MVKLISILLGKSKELTREEIKSIAIQMIMMLFLSFVTVFCMSWLNKMTKNDNNKSKSKTEKTQKKSSKTETKSNQSNKNKDKIPKGKERAAKFSNQWKKTDLNKNIKKFAGENPTISKTETGKTIYFNTKTKNQVVVDKAGKYFRIQNNNLTGKRCYLDLNGKVPNNKIINGKITGNSQSEYNQLTHFLFE